ncbi:hypothetical protein ACFW0P_16800 [Lysobacter soli]|uniref:hypothetical protein n=1 Tax=Lysobacter soli TaxID=453783 RepID=UPI003677641F
MARRKRSLEIPWLTIGAVALIGLPIVYEASRDPMSRNRYYDRSSCECDYGNRCERDYESGSWVGPWYASNAGDRKPDDPGEGACRHHYRGGGYYYGGGGSGGYRPPVGVQQGYRGGFGGTGRVHAAGS